jgi:uncharacterized protein YjiS (DUF1127 family)
MSTQDLYPQISEAPGRLLHGLAAFLRGLVRRRKFNQLRDLDDHILDDIGVTRREIEIATRLPFSHNAAEEVRRLSLQRRRDREAALRTRFRF